MKKLLIIIISFIILLVLVSCKVERNEAELDYSLEMYQLKEIKLKGIPNNFDLTELEDISSITVFTEYSTKINYEDLIGVYKFTGISEINTILNSFADLGPNTKYENSFDSTEKHMRIIIEITDGDFYDMSVRNDLIVVKRIGNL